MLKGKKLIDLGTRVKNVRLEKNLTQVELANRINKDQPSIQRLESGKINPSYLYLSDIAEGLGVELHELLNF